MYGALISFVYNNFGYILLYLIIGGFICTRIGKYCPAMNKKEQKKMDKVSAKNLYLNKIDIIENKVFFIIAFLIIGIIWLFTS